jgi:hypothetical protein
MEGLVVGDSADLIFTRWVRFHWKNLGNLTSAHFHVSETAITGVNVVSGVFPWDDLGCETWDVIFYSSPPSLAHVIAFLGKAHRALRGSGKVYIHVSKNDPILSEIRRALNPKNKKRFRLGTIFDQLPTSLLVTLHPHELRYAPCLATIHEPEHACLPEGGGELLEGAGDQERPRVPPGPDGDARGQDCRHG